MPKFVRFAVSFLSLAALPLFGATLRDMNKPQQLATVFPKTAKVRVLNVWATWCIPCVHEMPDLRAIDQMFGEEVALVGVSLDDMLPNADRKKTAAFLDKQQITFPNVFWTGSADDLGAYLKSSGEIPLTIFYDASGKELWRHDGRINKEETIARLRTILGRKK